LLKSLEPEKRALVYGSSIVPQDEDANEGGKSSMERLIASQI